MTRRVSCPGPQARCAIGMNQLVEKSLSLPRGPLCCVSVMKALAWNMSVQLPCVVMSIGVGVDDGSRLVPDEAWRSMVWMRLACVWPECICIWAGA